VETKAKRFYNQLAGGLLRGRGEENIAGMLEVLKLFLESVDFSRLRGASEKHLIAGRKVTFILYLEEGDLKCEMKVA